MSINLRLIVLNITSVIIGWVMLIVPVGAVFFIAMMLQAFASWLFWKEIMRECQ